MRRHLIPTAFLAAVVWLAAGSVHLPAQGPNAEQAPSASVSEAVDRVAGDYERAVEQAAAIREAAARLPVVAEAPRVTVPVGDGEDDTFPTPAPYPSEELVEIIGPDKPVKPGDYFIVSLFAPDPVEGQVASGKTATAPDGAPQPMRLRGERAGESVYLYQQVTPGEYVFRAAAQVNDPATFDRHDIDELIVVVAAPTPPVPPGPDPPTPPVPPEPMPDTVGPIFGVVLYDSEGDDAITPAQRNSLNSADVHAYLAAKALKVGGHPQWRVWDDDKLTDAHLSEESEVLRKAYAEAKAKYAGKAHLVLSNGKTGYSGPLPETHEAILTLLKKYGG